MPSSAECGYTQSVCGYTGTGLRQATRMRIAHVRMWAVAREYIHTADHPDGQSEGCRIQTPSDLISGISGSPGSGSVGS